MLNIRKMNLRTIAASLLFAFSTYYSAYAQYSETIVSDRPGQSNSPNTVGKLVLQIQSGPQFDGRSADNYKAKVFSWPAVVRFGITDKIEVNTLWGYQNVKVDVLDWDYRANGINLSDFGLRFNIFEETNSAPSLGFEAYYVTKIKSEDFNQDYPAARFNLMASKSLTDIWTITSNLGVNFDSNGGGAEGFYTLNLSMGLSDELAVYVENYGYFTSSSYNTYFDFGCGYLLNNNLQLDLYGGLGRNNETFSYMVSTGISYRIVSWRKE